MDAILETVHLSKKFGGLEAVTNLSFSVGKGELMGIIGPNGAGKTTLFNLLTGFLSPTSGDIVFNGRSIVGKKPFEIVSRGISRTFQIVRPFQQLTLLDNVMVPLQAPKNRKKNRDFMKNQERAAGILDQVGLADKMLLLAADLSHGDLRRLEVARALATSPDLILLDEPFSGLAISEIESLSDLIRKLREGGQTIIIIEHVLRQLMKLVERILVIHFGAKLADGPKEAMARDPKVIEAYMGEKGEEIDVPSSS
ncbi:MAG: ABC transporter ATP-binding protein [Pseudomonadota bacterium]